MGIYHEVSGGEENGEAAELYMEYVYDFFDEALPDNFYNSNATLYIMDVKSQRFVLKPKGMGERDAGHLNLQDFCRANQIVEADIQNMITEKYCGWGPMSCFTIMYRAGSL